MTAKSNESRVLPAGFIPSSHDVICGRDQDSIVHDGNARLRRIIGEFLPTYQKASTKKDKTLVVMEIVDRIRNEREVGGFVRKDLDTGRWIEIGRMKAREKVGHIIRIELKRMQKRQKKSELFASPSTTPSPTLSPFSMPSEFAGGPPPGELKMPSSMEVATSNAESYFSDDSAQIAMLTSRSHVSAAPLPYPSFGCLDLSRHRREQQDDLQHVTNKILSPAMQLGIIPPAKKSPKANTAHQQKQAPFMQEASTAGTYFPLKNTTEAPGPHQLGRSSSDPSIYFAPSPSLSGSETAHTRLFTSSASMDDVPTGQEATFPALREDTPLPILSPGKLVEAAKPQDRQSNCYYYVPRGLARPPASAHSRREIYSPNNTEEERLDLRLLPIPDNLTIRESLRRRSPSSNTSEQYQHSGGNGGQNNN